MHSMRTLLLILLLPAGSCGMNGRAPIDCAGWKPILLTRATIDAMQDVDTVTILAHNQHGRSRGCW